MLKFFRASSDRHIRGVLKIASGSIGAQILALCALPFLSRIYTPDAFGVFSFTLALSGVIVPLSMMRLEAAIMLPVETAQIRALVLTAFISICTVTSVVVVCTTWAMSVDGLLKVTYPYLPVWLGLSVFLTSTFILLSELALRQQQYGLVAKRTFAQALVTNSTQLTSGLLGLNAGGLLLGSIIGRFAGIGILFRSVRDDIGPTRPNAVIETLKEYWRFPLLFTPSHVLNGLGVYAPLLFFAAHFGTDIAGQVGMAERIVAIPLTLIGLSIGQVFSAELGRAIRSKSGGYLRIYMRTSAMLALIASVVGVSVIVFAPWAFPLVLGQDWATAGVCAQAMALTVSLRLVAAPTGMLFPLFQRSIAVLMLDVFRVLIVAVSIALVSSLSLELIPAVMLVYGSLAATYAITWIVGWRIVSDESRRPSL